MAKAFSDDLRRKLLKAYEARKGTLKELAMLFNVSYPYALKIRVQQLRTGKMERKPQSQHGPTSRITEPVKMKLRSLLKSEPQLTLDQLREQLEISLQVKVSKSLVWQAVQKLGLRPKKKHSRRASPAASKAR